MSTLVFVEHSPLSGREIPAIEGTVVGRVQCDVVLLDSEVSRRHAVVLATPAGTAIEDLGSTTGTWVGGRRIAGAHRLSAGDVVRFGPTVGHVRAGDQGSSDWPATSEMPIPGRGEPRPPARA